MNFVCQDMWLNKYEFFKGYGRLDLGVKPAINSDKNHTENCIHTFEPHWTFFYTASRFTSETKPKIWPEAKIVVVSVTTTVNKIELVVNDQRTKPAAE